MKISRLASGLAGAALALLLVCTLALPALAAGAEAPASYSAQLQVQVDGQDLSVKLQADLENLVFSLLGQVAVEGEPMAQLGLFCSDRAIAFQDSVLLGGTYGIDLSRLAQNLPGSVFAPNSGSVLALDRKLYDALLKEQTADADFGIIGGADGPTALFVTGNLPSAILKAVSTRVGPGELVLESGTILTTETTVTLDAKGMAKLASTILAEIQNDQDAKARLNALLDKLSILPGASKYADLTKTQADLEETLTQAGAHLTATIALDRKTKEPVSCCATWTYDGQTLDLQAVPAAGSYSLTRSSADGQTSTTTLSVDENSQDAFSLQYDRTEGTLVNSELRFRWDKQEGTYVLNVRSGEELDELTGTVQTAENSLVITADTANGQELAACSLTLRRDDPAQIPAFQEILTMSEDGILQTLQTAMTAAGRLLASVA